jgi:alpha/beta superfamily hydrolase
MGYKRVNGFCVVAKAIAPSRSDTYRDGSALAVIPPPRSMVGGQVAVTVVVLAAMALVAVAAVFVYRANFRQKLRLNAEEVAKQAGVATD